MSLTTIAERISASDAAATLRDWTTTALDTFASDGSALSIQVKGAAGSVPAFLLTDAHAHANAPLFCLLPDEDAASYLQADLEQLAGETTIVRFPATQRTPYDNEQLTESGPLIERADALQQLDDTFRGIVVTSVPAVAELVPPPDSVQRETLSVDTGDEISPDALVERLIDQGFRPARPARRYTRRLPLRGRVPDPHRVLRRRDRLSPRV